MTDINNSEVPYEDSGSEFILDSSNIEDDDTISSCSDNEETQEPVTWGDFSVVTYRFTDQRNTPVKPLSTLFHGIHPGVTLNELKCSENCFTSFISRKIVKSLCDWTNERAGIYLVENGTLKVYSVIWKDVIIDEIETTCNKKLVSSIFTTKENWSNRLPEIDIIPVLKQEVRCYDDPDLDIYDSDKDSTENSKKTILKQKPTKANSTGYKNPFNYVNCRMPKKNKEVKQPEVNANKWICMICNEVTIDKESLISHYEQHKNEKESKLNQTQHQNSIEDYFKCVVCTREFTSSRSYEKHLEHKHGENRYACEQCNKTYKNSFQLCIHNFTAHAEDDKYKCIACDFTTANRASLKSHIQKHEKDYKYQCEICDKSFFTSTWFEEHKNSHIGAMPFQCDICSKSFPYSRYLIAHKKSVHPKVYSGFSNINKCEVCDKQFAHRKSLILHIRSHTGENTVLCDMCGKRLSSTEHLKQHLRIHTGYKPHVCAVCGKGFAKKSNLTLHERVHSGEKPYICRECGKCFSQRSTLVIHERYHSGERPYNCPLCNKGFVAKGLLGVHLKSCSRISL